MYARISSCMCGDRDANTIICYTSNVALANRAACYAELIITNAAHTSHQTKQTHLHTEMAEVGKHINCRDSCIFLAQMHKRKGGKKGGKNKIHSQCSLCSSTILSSSGISIMQAIWAPEGSKLGFVLPHYDLCWGDPQGFICQITIIKINVFNSISCNRPIWIRS